MISAIIGDIVGSIYEAANYSGTDIILFTSENSFTDDTVLTIATAHALMGWGIHHGWPGVIKTGKIGDR